MAQALGSFSKALPMSSMYRRGRRGQENGADGSTSYFTFTFFPPEDEPAPSSEHPRPPEHTSTSPPPANPTSEPLPPGQHPSDALGAPITPLEPTTAIPSTSTTSGVQTTVSNPGANPTTTIFTNAPDITPSPGSTGDPNFQTNPSNQSVDTELPVNVNVPDANSGTRNQAHYAPTGHDNEPGKGMPTPTDGSSGPSGFPPGGSDDQGKLAGKSLNVGLIIGCLLAALVLIGLAIFFLWRRRRRRGKDLASRYSFARTDSPVLESRFHSSTRLINAEPSPPPASSSWLMGGRRRSIGDSSEYSAAPSLEGSSQFSYETASSLTFQPPTPLAPAFPVASSASSPTWHYRTEEDSSEEDVRPLPHPTIPPQTNHAFLVEILSNARQPMQQVGNPSLMGVIHSTLLNQQTTTYAPPP